MKELETQNACKWPFALVDGVRKNIADATSRERGKCPLCGCELVARKGAIRVPHWGHINGRVCDPWYESKGPWHRYWQDMFPEDWQERVVEKNGQRHIADILTDQGIVVEAQWSAISREAIAVREKFYHKMLWIVGMRRLESTMRIKEELTRGAKRMATQDKYRMSILHTCDFPPSAKWLYCSRPVLCDFDGEFEQPESHAPFWYIMPTLGEDDGVRYCIEVPREDLIQALQNGDTCALLRECKTLRDDYERQNAREKKKREQIMARAQAARIQQVEAMRLSERRKAEPYRNDADHFWQAISFANRQFPLLPQWALTIGCIDAYRVLNGEIERLSFSSKSFNEYGLFAFAPYGRIAIHCTAYYSRDDYKRDCRLKK